MGSEKDPLIPKDVALTDSGRPVVKRSVHWALLSFLILGEIAGQGVFALPLHLGRLGWFAGTLTCFGTLAINNISLRIMYATHTRFPEAKSQGEAAGILFGPVGQGFIRAVVHLYLFTIQSAYLNSLGRTIMNEFYGTRVCLPLATGIAALIVFPFAQLRSYGDITGISIASFAAVVAVVFLIVGRSRDVDPDPTSSTSFWPPLGITDSLTSVGGFFFASGGGQCAFFEYLSEMSRPEDYPKTLWLTTPALFALYYGTAAAMYARFGDKVPGFLLDILPFDASRLVGNTLFFFHIIVSFVILNSALLRAYARYSVTDSSNAARRDWAGLSAIVVLGAYVLTNTVSLFEDLTAAIGSLFVSTTVLLIPPAYLYAAHWFKRREDPERGAIGRENNTPVKRSPSLKKLGGFIGKFSPMKKGRKETPGGDAGGGGSSGGSTPGESTPRPTGFEVHWSVLWSLRVMLAVAVVAVPVLSWGSLVRLVQDMATLAPPFSCGPCVTKECIENERAESAMAYLGLLERRVRGAALRG